MLAVMIALAAQTVAPATPAAPATTTAARRLQDLPGIAISYRDLNEKDVKTINKALSKNKQLTPEQQALLGAKTNWTAGGSMTRLTKDGVCTVTKIDPAFKATAELPRFNEAWIPAKDLPAWKAYAAAMETQAAAKLWYPYDRLPAVEQAIVGKPCDQATKDGVAALEKLKAEARAFQPAAPASVPAVAPAAN